MRILLHFVDLTFAIFTWVLLAYAVLYWLIGFNRVDPRLPGLGGVDISPLVAIMLIAAARYVIALYILPKLA
jgi:uncharacterized protein YggT (Ycf19 family)